MNSFPIVGLYRPTNSLKHPNLHLNIVNKITCTWVRIHDYKEKLNKSHPKLTKRQIYKSFQPKGDVGRHSNRRGPRREDYYQIKKLAGANEKEKKEACTCV